VRKNETKKKKKKREEGVAVEETRMRCLVSSFKNYSYIKRN